MLALMVSLLAVSHVICVFLMPWFFEVSCVSSIFYQYPSANKNAKGVLIQMTDNLRII